MPDLRWRVSFTDMHTTEGGLPLSPFGCHLFNVFGFGAHAGKRGGDDDQLRLPADSSQIYLYVPM